MNIRECLPARNKYYSGILLLMVPPLAHFSKDPLGTLAICQSTAAVWWLLAMKD